MNKFKLLYIFCLVLTMNYATAQKCSLDMRYTNTDYFSKSQIDSLKNVTYGEALNYMGNLQDLKMDVYFPNTDIDTQEKRPLILLIHGGSFTGGTRESMTYHSKELSKRGFVVATISYRLGYNREVFGDDVIYLKENMNLKLTSYEGEILDYELPQTLDYELIEVENAVTGDRANNPQKEIILETGLRIQAPMFVNVGDIVKVNIEKGGEYVTRVDS